MRLIIQKKDKTYSVNLENGEITELVPQTLYERLDYLKRVENEKKKEKR